MKTKMIVLALASALVVQAGAEVVSIRMYGDELRAGDSVNLTRLLDREIRGLDADIEVVKVDAQATYRGPRSEIVNVTLSNSRRVLDSRQLADRPTRWDRLPNHAGTELLPSSLISTRDQLNISFDRGVRISEIHVLLRLPERRPPVLRPVPPRDDRRDDRWDDGRDLPRRGHRNIVDLGEIKIDKIVGEVKTYKIRTRCAMAIIIEGARNYAEVQAIEVYSTREGWLSLHELTGGFYEGDRRHARLGCRAISQIRMQAVSPQLFGPSGRLSVYLVERDR